MTEDRADHLEENRAGPATSPLLRPGMGQTNCKYKCVGPGRVRMNLSVNSALYFHMDLIQTTKLPLPPPKPSPVPSVPGYIWPFGRDCQSGNHFQNVRLLRGPDPFCLSVLSFSVPTPMETQFPIVSVFPLLLDNRALLFIPWAMVWKCQQLGICDVGCRTGWHKAPEKGQGGD